VKNVQNSVEEKISDETESENGIDQKYLTFWTDGELFGIPISDVVQIISIQEITPLPDFPEYAKGVINLRGNIIPAIDIRLRFGKPEVEYNENTCIIVTRIEDAYMGFIVDSVDEVTDIEDDDITPAPKVSKDVTNKYLMGIGQIGERVVLLLDVGKVLTENEYKRVRETTAQTAEQTAGGEPARAEDPAIKDKTAEKAEKETNVTPMPVKKPDNPSSKNK
jgi:purine-binding chemotaxis protein CheW